jgi:hypothetical protein
MAGQRALPGDLNRQRRRTSYKNEAPCAQNIDFPQKTLLLDLAQSLKLEQRFPDPGCLKDKFMPQGKVSAIQQLHDYGTEASASIDQVGSNGSSRRVILQEPLDFERNIVLYGVVSLRFLNS